jgi:glycine betaine catabolism A
MPDTGQPEPWKTLPARNYFSPEIYELEKERIFYRSWFCVGRAGEIANPRDFIARKVGDEHVVILRDENGELRAYYNVCSHRGHRVCVGESGSLKGGVMVCGYHAWTYGMDGKLAGTPRMADTQGFRREAYRLKPLHVHVWEGFLFISMADEPEAFVPNLGGIADRVPYYAMPKLAAGRRQVYDVKANWKLIVENFTECFHCPTVHPELCVIVPGFRSGVIQQENPGGAVMIGNSMTMDASTKRPLISTLEEQDTGRFRSTTVYPNLLLVMTPDHVESWTLWPTGPKTTRLAFEWLFEPEVIARADFDMADVAAFMDMVNRQDFDVCERVQEGMQSRAFTNGVYSSGEHLPHKFNQWVLSRLAS